MKIQTIYCDICDNKKIEADRWCIICEKDMCNSHSYNLGKDYEFNDLCDFCILEGYLLLKKESK